MNSGSRDSHKRARSTKKKSVEISAKLQWNKETIWFMLTQKLGMLYINNMHITVLVVNYGISNTIVLEIP